MTERPPAGRRRRLPPSTTRLTLAEHGFALLRGAVPADACERAAAAIQRDVGARLDAGSPHQEEPVERLRPETRRELEAVRDWVLDRVVRAGLGLADAHVPGHWSETLYGRVKRRDFHTRWHTDALNTVFQRDLLTDPEHVERPHARWVAFRESGRLGDDARWSDLPIFTFWVALRDLTDPAQSHLRLHVASHRMPGCALSGPAPAAGGDPYASGAVVAPRGYAYCSSNFVGPDKGYGVGDVVVFHCLTVHEANPHRVGGVSVAAGAGAGAGRDSERVSMDGRFFSLAFASAAADEAGSADPPRPRKRARGA